YKEREVKYIEKIRILEMYRASNLKSIKFLNEELEEVKLEKDGLDGKLAGLLKASKNLDHLIESQMSDQVKEGVGYNVVPPPAADLYLSPKKDLSWTSLPEFVDDTVTDYSRTSPTIEIKFVKAGDRPAERPTTNKAEIVKKPTVKYAEIKMVKRGTFGSQNGAPMRPPYRPADHRPHDPPMRHMRSNMNGARPNRTSFNKQAHSYSRRPFQETTQDLMIILIQRVQRLERELKARAPIHKCVNHLRRSYLRIFNTYEEFTQQPSPAYVANPMELEHHVPMYVPEPVYPEYLVHLMMISMLRNRRRSRKRIQGRTLLTMLPMRMTIKMRRRSPL
nr:hypothetical protein [Tanacetum cinerariifolium]